MKYLESETAKRQVLVYFPRDLHRELKKLAADRDTTMSDLLETAARAMYPSVQGMIVSERVAPWGRTTPSTTKKTKEGRGRRTK